MLDIRWDNILLFDKIKTQEICFSCCTRDVCRWFLNISGYFSNLRVTEHIDHIEVVESKIFRQWHKLELDTRITYLMEKQLLASLSSIKWDEAKKDKIVNGEATTIRPTWTTGAWKPINNKCDTGCKCKIRLRKPFKYQRIRLAPFQCVSWIMHKSSNFVIQSTSHAELKNDSRNRSPSNWETDYLFWIRVRHGLAPSVLARWRRLVIYFDWARGKPKLVILASIPRK